MGARELRAQRAEVLAEAKKVIDGAENGVLTDEQRSRVDELTAQAERMNGDIQRMEKVEGLRRDVNDPAPALIGMSRQETQRYSLMRAINAAAASARGEAGAWRQAGLEWEASQAVAEKMGKTPRSFFMPYDVQESRDMVVGTAASGGYLTADELRPTSMIELLRNKLILKAAGAQFLGGLVGDILVPKQSGGATAYWVAESGAPTEGAQTVAQLSLSPKEVGAYTDISRKLLKQSSIDVEMFVRNDLTQVLALAIDLAGLHGTGSSNQPTGVAATSGIGSVAGGTDGAAPDWADIVDLETAVAIDNADLGKLAYITNAKVRGKLKKTLVTATYGDRMIWENGPDPLNGYPALVTNQVSSVLEKGSSGAVCSAIFFGNWNDLIVGEWGGLDVLVDPYTGSSSGTVRVTAFKDIDIGVRHAESFAAMLDALTS